MKDEDYEIDAHLLEALALDERAGPARRVASATNDALVLGVLDAWQPVAVPQASDGDAATSGAASAAKVTSVLKITSAIAFVIVGAHFAASSRAPASADASRAPVLTERVSSSRAPSFVVATGAFPVRVEVATPVIVPSTSLRDTPAEAVDLLERANTLRREGRFAQAAAVYEQVVRRAPTSREASVARVAAGSVRLDGLHDARGALRLFRAAMRGTSGTLAAEASFGLARAARALGDRETEREALEVLVRRHASSAYGAMATRRLAALDTPHARTRAE